MINGINRYPYSDTYEYETYMETINFDKECSEDIASGKGFRISNFHSVKKDLKDPDGIFSYRFGQSLNDVNTYINRYRCKCGKTKFKIMHGIICPECGYPVEYVDDDFEYFGWIILDKHVIIQPAYYKKLEIFFGKGAAVNGVKRSKLENIIDIVDNRDINGYSTTVANPPKAEPFFGIGMMEFHRRFYEIMNYYYKSKPNKVDMYNDIMDNYDKVFTHCIPVFSTLLRPVDIKDNTMSYELTTAMYMMMNRTATLINKNKTKFDRDPKAKNQKLYNLQMKFMQLYEELENMMSGKKGDIRCLLGGRYNFSSRSVIVQDPDLRIDEITLPYNTLVILLQQRIENLLHRLYNIPFADTYQIWYRSLIEEDQRVTGIINSIIEEYKRTELPGIPFIINRNPTIGYGSILQVFCKKYTKSYTMGVSLQVLKLLGADFDGDVLNILLIINKTFLSAAREIFNPRNAFYISRNDGYFNTDVSMQRDTLINANTLVGLGRKNYSKDEIDKIRYICNKNKEIYY